MHAALSDRNARMQPKLQRTGRKGTSHLPSDWK